MAEALNKAERSMSILHGSFDREFTAGGASVAVLDALLCGFLNTNLIHDAWNILDVVRERCEKGEIKTGAEVKAALKRAIVDILVRANDGKEGTAPLKLNEGDGPSVIMVVGVNGGGKTTTVGKLSHRFAKESGAKVMLVPGDTFRAAAAEQLATWAERSAGVMATYKEGMKPGALCYQAVDQAIKMGDVDIVLADTSGRLHTNCGS